MVDPVLLLRLRKRRGFRRIGRRLLAIYGVAIPPRVEIGDGLRLAGRGVGTVIHPNTRIGDRVCIHQSVTIGRRDAHRRGGEVGVIQIGHDVVLCAGAVLLAGERGLTVADGTVVEANAVLSENTQPWEIWAGNPARRVARRESSQTSRPAADDER